MPSFLSEHSVEYAIVPALSRLLSGHYPSISPIFYWKSREGSVEALLDCGFRSCRLVLVYPRRPKTRRGEDERYLKFNAELFKAATFWGENGIPVLGCSPDVRSVCEFGVDSTLIWFQILPDRLQEDAYWPMETPLPAAPNSPLRGPLSEREILALVENSGSHLFQEVADLVREQPRHERSWTPWLFGGGYKPIFFLLWS